MSARVVTAVAAVVTALASLVPHLRPGPHPTHPPAFITPAPSLEPASWAPPAPTPIKRCS